MVLNGQEEEKATWTFRLIDCENKGYFVMQDFSTLIKLMVEAWIFWTGNQLCKFLIFFYVSLNGIILKNILFDYQYIHF